MGQLVTAIVVSHDGEHWLAPLLAGLQSQQRAPDLAVAVDTASTDGSVRLLEAALGRAAVVRAGRTDGYGDALRHGVAAADRLTPGPAPVPVERRWLWLLPDDCVPAPDALAALLRAAEQDPAAGVVGAKVREWPSGAGLLSVGTAITGTGRRETGVEPGELDQGQHDAVRAVLAVDSAGMLVRRDVWDELGGFDRRLPLFRDDVDFGWRATRAGHRVIVCPQAVVFHAEAAARGVRPVSNTARRPHRADRRAALFTLLANCRGVALPFLAARLLAGCLLRAAGFLLGKAPGLAADELAALAAVLCRPRAVIDARHERRRTARVPAAAVRPLLPPWWLPYRRGVEAIADRLRAGRQPAPEARVRHRAGAETGPVAEEAESLTARPGALAGALRRPYTVVLLATLAVAIVAGRGLIGSGLLQGGALLPAPDGAADLWRTYLSSWHPVGLGSDAVAPPYIALLAGLASVLGGKPWLAVDVVFLLAVPLAATTAYLASRRWIGSPVVRAWLAAGYGLLPVLTGAVAQGRLGTVAASIVAPLAARSAVLLFTVRPRRQEGTDPRWRAAFATGLWLAVLLALVPLSYPLAVAALGCLAAALVRSAAAAARVLTAAVLPAVLALPWTRTLLAEPARWLTEAGAVDTLESGVPAQGLQLVLGRPGGPGAAPAWIGVGVLLAAAVALLRRDRRGAVSAAWVVGLLALAAGAAASGRVVQLPQFPDGFVAWPGFAVTVAFGAALAAAALAADGAGSALAGGSFGWRQPLAAGVAVVAGVAPLLGLGWWLAAGAGGPLHRGPAIALPTYLVTAQLGPARPRTLVVDADARPVTYQVVRDDGMRTGDEALAPPARDSATLDRLVARLVSDPTDADARALADYAVANLLLAAPVDPRVATGLDALPSLERASAGGSGAAAWRLTTPTGRARLLPASGTATEPVVLPSGPVVVATRVPRGPVPREVALAETPDPGWRAILGGTELAAVDPPGWGQRFAVGGAGGALLVEPDDDRRREWLLAQLGMVVLAVVLASPGLRRTGAVGAP